jgi:phage terminase large subunit
MEEKTKIIKLTPFYKKHVFNKEYKVIIQIGGRFSSKSYNSEIEMAYNLSAKKKYKLLVIEDLDAGLTKGYYAGLKDKIEQFEQDKAYKFTKSPAEIKNVINKNTTLFSGYATDQQKKAVKAIDQVTAILVEEGEWITYDDFTAMLHQLRGGSPEDRKLTILMNPVNPDCFVNEMFIESKPDRVIEYFPGTNRPKVFEKNIVTTFEYEGEIVTDTTKVLIVLSTHHDNPYLTIDQRATIEQLKITDPDKYLQLGEARFVRSKGVFFPEFKRETHVIEPFVIPDHWHRYTTKDYGLDMLAQYWIAIDTEDNAYVYKELHESDLIVSAATTRIKEINNNDVIKTKYAPPDLENRQKDTGKSIFDLFRENGEVLTKSDNRRVDGWLAVKEWIKVIDTVDIETGEPIKTSRLKIFSNCENLINCMRKIMKDEKDANDAAKIPHDITHAPDSLRYFCIMRQVTPVIKVNKVQKGFYLESELMDMVAAKKITNYQMKQYLSKGVKSW